MVIFVSLFQISIEQIMKNSYKPLCKLLISKQIAKTKMGLMLWN